MLGAGWAAGVVGAAAHAGPGGTSINALGNNAVGSTLAPTATGASGSPTPSPSASASAGASSAPATTSAPAAPATSAPAAAAPAPAAPAPAPAAPAPVSGTFDGSAVGTAYGPYQATITVTAGKITGVTMVQSGNSDGTSRQISGYALPLLISAVLQQQTWNVGYVSGASYTTQGFEGTVQSAMQAAGLA